MPNGTYDVYKNGAYQFNTARLGSARSFAMTRK
jgi:hypothetical protein